MFTSFIVRVLVPGFGGSIIPFFISQAWEVSKILVYSSHTIHGQNTELHKSKSSTYTSNPKLTKLFFDILFSKE